VVRAVRSKKSQRRVANQFRVSLRFVRYWCERAGDTPIGRIDWRDHRSDRGVTHNRTNHKIERCVLEIRKNLKDESALGEYGAEAIHRAMVSFDCPVIPAIRTINSILQRNGCIDAKRRIRYPAPPLAWHIPEVADGKAERDSCDHIEDLRLKGKNGFVHIFNIISIHGGLVGSFPLRRITAENTVSSLLKHWEDFGFPEFVQFDNATVFTGPRHPNCVGQTVRFCLSLGITPVFVPPRETGFQANVERFNGLWQKANWERFNFKNLEQLNKQSNLYVEALRDKKHFTIQTAPDRDEIPKNGIYRYDNPLKGKMILIKRTDNYGYANVLGNNLWVDNLWTNRLVRAEININKKIINFYR
jgi:hypothetical protein